MTKTELHSLLFYSQRRGHDFVITPFSFVRRNRVPLRQGNRKLGLLVHQWSIPSGLKKICVGATKICLMICYAMRHHYCRPTVKRALERNYKLSQKEEFPSIANHWIRTMSARVIRVHASGEFYDAEYVEKWIRIVDANPYVTFFSYTRSWRDPEILPALRRLARRPNFHMWWSCDSLTGAPPRVAGVRRAYLAVDKFDTPRYRVDLVFRYRPNTVQKWVNGALVCPEENGITQTTCSQCQLCFQDRPMPKEPQRDRRRTDPRISRSGSHALPVAH